jgi:two-component system, cell cycle sensor histidine kinase and response regulator CckA
MVGDTRPTILVVEDDERVRDFISTTLAAADYNVLQAKGGLDGISTMLRYDGEISMAVVEIKMPGINGLDLANQIGIERPATEVLYVSDLDRSVAVESIAREKPEAMLPRPFTAGQLLKRVRHLSRRTARRTANAR